MIDKIIEKLWDIYFKPRNIEIKKTGTIENGEIKNILSKYTSNIWIGDDKYNLIDTNNFKHFLELNPVSKRKYLVDAQDCDKFSFELKGDVTTWYSESDFSGSFGIVWGNRAGDGLGHAWNFIINEKKELMFVEPQNDSLFLPTDEKIWIMIV